MSANVLIFEEFAGSGRGLLARPLLPNNITATRTNIGEIGYTIKNLITSSVVTGVLDPAVVMLASPMPWKFDPVGYTFFWAAFGTLWPNVNTDYRIVIDFLIEAPGTQLHGFGFKLAYQAKTKDPLG
jgi:hypothetical protein